MDFTDATTYYNVSTVNYLAAGSCNFNDAGVTLWPLNQIVADTQYYVRDAVIDYTHFHGHSLTGHRRTPQLHLGHHGSCDHDCCAHRSVYLHPATLTLDFVTEDANRGVKAIEALLDGKVVEDGQNIDLYTLALGDHTLTIKAVDKAGNASTQSVTFSITATIDSLKTAVDRFYNDGSIKNKGVYKGLARKC